MSSMIGFDEVSSDCFSCGLFGLAISGAISGTAKLAPSSPGIGGLMSLSSARDFEGGSTTPNPRLEQQNNASKTMVEGYV